MSEAHDTCCVARGDETYLSPEQLRYFHDRLLTWRRELCRSLAGSPGEVIVESLPDWVDSAAHSSQVALSLAERERTQILIRQIDAALKRIMAGTYGYCVASGDEIGLQRLMALPTAQYSLETQQEIERGKKRFR